MRAGSLGTLEGKLTRREEFKELRAPFLEGLSSSVVLSQRQFCPPGTLGDIWGHFRLSQRGGGSDTGIEWVQGSDAAQHPIMHRTVPQEQEGSGPNVNSVGTGKPCSGWIVMSLRITTGEVFKKGKMNQEVK